FSAGHPPRPPLFPYTTLFRSVAKRAFLVHVAVTHAERTDRRCVARRTLKLELLGVVKEVRGEFHLRLEIGESHGLRARIVEFGQDRKSTRLNSSHVSISYAVF